MRVLYDGLLVLRRESEMKNRVAYFVLALLLPALSIPPLYADCSGNLCTDCDQSGPRHLASCTTVSTNASCECSISVQTPEFCVLGGACTYTSGGGGGGA